MSGSESDADESQPEVSEEEDDIPPSKKHKKSPEVRQLYVHLTFQLIMYSLSSRT
jgi:hypothetical protein